MAVLALQETEPMGLVRKVQRGLSLNMLEGIARRVSPDNAAFKYRIIAKATLERRKRSEAQNLTPEESAKVARISGVMDLALDVWKSDDSARAFLFRPHPLLEMQTPMDVVLMNEFGGQLVQDILNRLKYGAGL
jgi:putative toxin-antitoxin system antitoxin component (TIGR02293 family)